MQAVEAEVDALKKSVSDGKTLVANAITAKGITTATDATFQQMASNIAAIVTNSGYMLATYTDNATNWNWSASHTAPFSIRYAIVLNSSMVICAYANGSSYKGSSGSISVNGNTLNYNSGGMGTHSIYVFGV